MVPRRSIGLAGSAIVASLALGGAAEARVKILCPFLAAGHIEIDASGKPGDLPKVDFDYGVKPTLFSFRDGHLLLVAMDEEEASRLRIVISAQAEKPEGPYRGQFVVDMGGNQLMVDSGPVVCTVTP